MRSLDKMSLQLRVRVIVGPSPGIHRTFVLRLWTVDAFSCDTAGQKRRSGAHAGSFRGAVVTVLERIAMKRMGAVSLKGNPVDLKGRPLQAGDAAPDFKLQDTGLQDVSLSDSAGKTRIVVTVPSLDTSVCHAETKRFNDEAKQLANVEILVVSMDLPFGQKRWCGSEGVETVKTLSAHRCTDFGYDYGVLIAGGPLDRCLARAVFVIDPSGKVTYAEYCAEIAEHPNYEAILAAAKA